VEGQEIHLSGVTSDEDGWVIGFEWSDHGAGGTFLPSPNDETPVYLVPNVSGCGNASIEITLTVTDDWGAQASDSLTITIEDANDPPWVDAGGDRTVGSGDRVELDGTATDADGAIVSILWEQTEGPPVDLTEPDRLDARFDAPEVWDTIDLGFRLTVRDDCGAEADDRVTIHVSPGGVPVGAGGAARARVAVSIEAWDDRGFALPPFSAPAWGTTVRFEVRVTNTGEVSLADVTVFGMQEAIPMLPRDLAPSEVAVGTIALPFMPDAEGRFVFEVVARATDPWGRTIETTKTYLLLGEGGVGELTLLKQADRACAAVSETILYTYSLINSGGVPVENLLLLDDQIGETDSTEVHR
jgi:uncharacterized repeat protein (TIGR01451 family)